MGSYSGIDDGMRDIYGQSETLGGIASYLPGQNFAFDRDVITGMLDTLVSQGTSNIGGMLGLEGRIEAGMKALSDLLGFDATQATPEQIQEALNNVNDHTAGLINLTVGSNQMLSEADLAAAQEAGGSTSSLEVDADLMGTNGGIIDSTASAASTAGTGDTVVNTDTEHPWLYEGNGVLRNVFTGAIETNQSGTENLVVGETYSSGTPTEATTRSNDTTDSGNINIVLTPNGSGNTTSTVIDAASNGATNTAVVDGGGGLNTGDVTLTNGNGGGQDFYTARDSNNTGETLTVGGNGGGQDFYNARDTKNTGETLTVGDTVTKTTVTNGKDGGDGKDGKDGGDGKDGKDGKDGATGLIMMGMLSSPLANNIFKTEFESDYLRPEYVDRILRGKRMNNNGRNT